MRSTKVLVTLVLAVVMAVFATTAFATPLPNGTLLVINPGVSDPADPLGACIDGSCFSMYTNGTLIWTNFGPGTDGGFIVGKDQASGGQETDPSSINDGELSNAWSFFGSPGTFFTIPGGGAQNIFDNAPCTGAACNGKTVLAVFNVAWNGNTIPMGSAAGCTLGSCTPDQQAGIFVSDWQIDGINQTWSITYSQVVPSGGFANVPFAAIIRGTVDVCADVLTRCNDSNVCTTDSCDQATGNCIHTNNTLACNDSNACTTNDRCSAGVCAGTAKNCADTNPCTDDSCNPSNGLCVHNANTLPCDDNNACTTNDVCANKVCAGTSVNCNDNNVCTTDTCSAGVCSHVTVPTCPDAGTPMPVGTVLGITQGVGSGMNVQCATGSCFSMNVAVGMVQWTDFGPGNDGGFVVGKSQTSGGQEAGPSATNTTAGQLSNAWSFFSNYGTFFTTPGGDLNVFNNASCTGAACINKTMLKTLYVAWNGSIIPMGSASGCTLTNCTSDEKEGNFVNSYSIVPSTGGAWSINYSQVVPSGSYTNVPFGLVARGTVTMDLCADAATRCNDSNVCTTDTCDPATGNCVHTPNTLCSEPILWYNTGSGKALVQTTDGTTITGGTVIWTEPSAAWSIAGRGDFDGDGVQDYVWRNSSNGQVYLMFMTSPMVVKSGAVVWTEPDNSWEIVATGDLNGDGKTDLIWWNSGSGRVYGMLMNGSSTPTGATIWTEPDVTNWKIVAAGDLNNDGKADLIWWNSSSGQVFGMLMNGTTVSSSATIWTEPGVSNWRIVGAGDLNGDGKADLIWRSRTTGQVFGMLMNGLTVGSNAVVWTEPDLNWEIVNIGNYTGDNKADLLWRNKTTGKTYLLPMNGLSASAGSTLWIEPSSSWRIMGDTEWKNNVYGVGTVTP